MIGERLGQARREADVTITKAAAHVDISVDTLRRYERDETEPSVNTVRRLALLYGKPLEWFVEGVI